MNTAHIELQRLEQLITGSTPKDKSKPIQDTLDALSHSLQSIKDTCDAPDTDLPLPALLQLSNSVDSSKKDVELRQKEIYSALSKFGKALDKALYFPLFLTFPNPLPSYPAIFTSERSKAALDRTAVLHFLRTGNFELAQTLIQESSLDISPELRANFLELHEILEALRNENITPALQWVESNRTFLQSRSSPLEFHLHRSQYLRTLLSTTTSTDNALRYAKAHLQPFFAQYPSECLRLTGCIPFLPLSRLQLSPYNDLASPSLHADLQPLFAKEYCASLGMSRQLPFRVVGDIGGGGALSRIEKSRKVMKESKSEWSRRDELPIEIQLPPENRYHSIFTCPVSKEQSTPHNPPKMLVCGHVISSDSLQKLSKSGGRAKCPYCPTEFQASSAFQVYF